MWCFVGLFCVLVVLSRFPAFSDRKTTNFGHSHGSRYGKVQCRRSQGEHHSAGGCGPKLPLARRVTKDARSDVRKRDLIQSQNRVPKDNLNKTKALQNRGIVSGLPKAQHSGRILMPS